MHPLKPHLEFFPIDLETGWSPIPGYPPGMTEKALAGGLDEANRRGGRTRLLRIEPGAYSIKPFVHEYWEEVFLFEGDLVVGNDATGEGGEQFVAPTYACRPPGVHHGPFTSKGGCVLFEVHYFA
ncbi:MAG: hypothetical protein WED34_19895 [Planctomycetales bacterium]